MLFIYKNNPGFDDGLWEEVIFSPSQFFVLSGKQLQFPGKGPSALPRLSQCHAAAGQRSEGSQEAAAASQQLHTHHTFRALVRSAHGRSPSLGPWGRSRVTLSQPPDRDTCGPGPSPRPPLEHPAKGTHLVEMGVPDDVVASLLDVQGAAGAGRGAAPLLVAAGPGEAEQERPPAGPHHPQQAVGAAPAAHRHHRRAAPALLPQGPGGAGRARRGPGGPCPGVAGPAQACPAQVCPARRPRRSERKPRKQIQIPALPRGRPSSVTC